MKKQKGKRGEREKLGWLEGQPIRAQGPQLNSLTPKVKDGQRPRAQGEGEKQGKECTKGGEHRKVGSVIQSTPGFPAG